MKVKQIIESSAGSTSSGSIASVATPLGQTQKRAGSLFKGKKTKKKFYESPEFTTKQQVIDYFVRAGKSEKEGAAAWERGWRGKKVKSSGSRHWLDRWEKEKEEREDQLKTMNEEELQEDDVIIVPGMRRSKDTSFIPHAKDRRDHEVEMARSEVYAAAKDAMRIYKMIQNRSEDEGLMGWQQSYITLAADYLNSVADSLEHDAKVAEMTGGVLAGGMSNFEEGRYYDPMGDERREQQAMDDERRDFKRREQNAGLEGEEERARRYEQGPWYILKNGKLVKDKNKNPFTFNTLSAAQKSVKTMREKEWNKDKKFVYTRTPKDSDVSEGKYRGVPTKVQNMLDEIMLLRTQAEIAADRQQWKKVELLNDKIEQIEGIILQDPKGQAALDNFYKSLGNKVADDNVIENKCPSCGGELVSEEMINEKKDACYYKVKSRYKVWPSAYASGALVKCRKKGASNWGKNKK